MTALRVMNSVELKLIIVTFITISLSSCVSDTMLILSVLIPVTFAISDSISV